MIALSDDFYDEVVRHPVPNDLEAVKTLAASPAILVLYMWLPSRCFKAERAESIPIFGEFGLASQLVSVEYSRPRRFRAMLDQWLATIRAIWPDCPARISADGERLTVAHSEAVHRAQAQRP